MPSRARRRRTKPAQAKPYMWRGGPVRQMERPTVVFLRIDAAVLARLDAIIARDYPGRTRSAAMREIIGEFVQGRG